MTEILQCTMEKAKYEESPPQKRENEDEEGERRLKRKLDHQECSNSDNCAQDDPNGEYLKDSKQMGNLNEAKNVSINQ